MTIVPPETTPVSLETVEKGIIVVQSVPIPNERGQHEGPAADAIDPELEKLLQTPKTGLTEEEVAERLLKFGKNGTYSTRNNTRNGREES